MNARILFLLGAIIVGVQIRAADKLLVPTGPLAKVRLGMSMKEVGDALGSPLGVPIKNEVFYFGSSFLIDVGGVRYSPKALSYYDGSGSAAFLFFHDRLAMMQLDCYDRDPRTIIRLETAARADFTQRYRLVKADRADAKYVDGPVEVYLVHRPVDTGGYVRLVFRDRPLVEQMATLALRDQPGVNRRDLMRLRDTLSNLEE